MNHQKLENIEKTPKNTENTTYNVQVSYIVTKSTTVTVEAKSRDEAINRAYGVARELDNWRETAYLGSIMEPMQPTFSAFITEVA